MPKLNVSEKLLKSIRLALEKSDYLVGGPYPVYRLSEGHIDGEIYSLIQRLERCLNSLLNDNGIKAPDGARKSQDLDEGELIEYGFDLEGD